MQPGGVLRVVVLADVLAHLDRRHGVERLVGELPVVLQPDLDLVGEAERLDPGQPVGPLLGRERHARGPHAVVLGRVHEERRPPAADVQQPHAGPERELAADEVELVALGVDEAVGRGCLLRPVPARVGHLRVEEEGVEVVGEVVVVGDRGAVAAAGVQPPVQPGLRRRRPRPRPDRAEAQRQPGGRERLARARTQTGEVVRLRQRPEPGETVGDVALDLQVTGHERPGEPQLAGAPQQAPQGPAVPDDHDGAVGGACLGSVPRPDPHGQGGAEETLDHVGELRSDGPAHGRARENWKTSR